MSRWFRAYDDSLDDPKVQSLPGELFKAWYNLMCVSSKNHGKPFSTGEVAFRLRLKPAKAQAVVDELIARGLLDDTEQGIISHNWDKRQFKSDVTDPTAADRMRRYRGRHGSVTDKTVTVTDTRAETEQNRAEQKRKSAAGAALPSGWQPTEDDYEYGKSLGLSGADIAGSLEEMRLWAVSNSNRQIARKANWNTTFRAWMRRNSKGAKANANPGNVIAAADRLVERLADFRKPAPLELRSGAGAIPIRAIPERRGE